MGQSPGETQCELPVVSPSGVAGTALILLARMCDSSHRVLPPREAHPSLGVQGFYWSLVMQVWLTAHVADFGLQPLHRSS